MVPVTWTRTKWSVANLPKLVLRFLKPQRFSRCYSESNLFVDLNGVDDQPWIPVKIVVIPTLLSRGLHRRLCGTNSTYHAYFILYTTDRPVNHLIIYDYRWYFKASTQSVCPSDIFITTIYQPWSPPRRGVIKI